MEKRVFLAIFLCFLVLAGYQYLVPPPPEPPAPTSAAATPGPTAPGPTASAGARGAAGAGAVPGEAPDPRAQLATAVETLVADSAPHDIVVETDSVRAVFSTAGATLRSWQLKKFYDARPGHGHEPLDLVPRDLPETLPRPFTMLTDDAPTSAVLASALYQPSAPAGLSLGSTAGTLSFEYRDKSGLNARKTFHFQPEGKPYLLNVEAAVDVNGASRAVRLDWGPALGLGYRPDGSREVPMRAVLFRDDKVERVAASKLLTAPHYEGALRYAGADEQYFLSVVVPGTQTVQVDYQPITLPVLNDPKKVRNFVSYSVRVPGAATLAYFLGPKDLDVLRAVDPQLVRAIDFGMFAWLVVPLLQGLKWTFGLLGNWGWAIVTLTIFINIIIFPLRHHSMVSMKKMQAIQPEVKAIQERYAKYKVTDPERQKMNTEMMALYKQKGVSPAAGCVPMLLTLPVLYAFYNLLYSSIELRGAPFLLWIHDLSAHDPYYVTPILMGATMFWQQRMMPSTADPIQQKVFLFMPLIFTVSFLWVPSGLVLYWMTSNLLAIGQQYLTNRMIATRARPAASLARR